MTANDRRANAFAEQRELSRVNAMSFGRGVEAVAEHEDFARGFEGRGAQLHSCDSSAEIGGGESNGHALDTGTSEYDQW